MAYLDDYIYSMEPVSLAVVGNGIAVLPLPTGQGTGTPGCVGIGTLPSLLAAGTADWAAFGAADLPALSGDGTTDGYRPAWGEGALPALVASGAGHVLIESVGLLPPLFGTGTCGAIGEGTIPSVTSYAIDDSFNRVASAAETLPSLTGEASVCGIDLPITNGATSAAVVNLLQQGSTPLADAAASICAGLTTDDARALTVLRYVANHTAYVSDGDGIGDRWTCALATYQRGYGDCEDGAILTHSLLLAAGVNPGRLRTAFGIVVTSALVEVGHAWLMYRRQTDEEWIPLDWTRGSAAYAGGLASIYRQCDLTDSYTKISYILTDERFFAVSDANYIARLVANRSTGAGTLPAVTGDSVTCIAATGAASIRPLAGAGQCGAKAAATLPSATGTGAASTQIIAWGVGSIAVLSGAGQTGAIGSGTLSKMTVTGQCGLSAKGAATLPSLAVTSAAVVNLVANGSGVIPALTGAGACLAGLLAAGAGMFPTLRGAGRASQGPLAQGSGTLPRLHGDGWASPLLVAVGDAELPPLVGRGHAVTTGAWAQTLQYNPARWA